MNSNPTTIKIVYDFDKTLSRLTSQDYGLFKPLNLENSFVWQKTFNFTKEQGAEISLMSMYVTIEMFRKAGIKFTRTIFEDLGKKIDFHKGVEEWFDHINNFARENNIVLEHYVVSSNYAPIINGTKIAKHFKKIYGCDYLYNKDDEPIWPKINITTNNKHFFLHRISAGTLNEIDIAIDRVIRRDDIDFSNMIYLGDSMGDIAAFEEMKKYGGISICVYNGGKKPDMVALEQKRVLNEYLKADYSEGSELANFIQKSILNIKEQSIKKEESKNSQTEK
ncbi:MAG: HAD family hydrolase [Spirochaetales bacterium]